MLNNFKVSLFVIFSTLVLLSSCSVDVSKMPISKEAKLKPVTIDYVLNAISEETEIDVNALVRVLKNRSELRLSQLDSLSSHATTWLGTESELTNVLADYYIEQQKFDKAEAVLAIQARGDQISPKRYALKTSTALGLSKLELAIDLINEGLLIDDADPELYERKGDIYRALYDTTAARQQYAKSFTLDTTRESVLVKLAQSLMHEQRYTEVEELLQKASIDNDQKEVIELLASLYQSQGRTEEAKSQWRRLLYAGDKSAGYSLIGLSQQSLAYDSTLYYANAVLQQDSLDLTALLAKARVFDARGYTTSAISYFERVLEQDSTHKDARLGLEKVYRKIAYLRRLKERRESTPRLEIAAPRKNSN